MDEDVVFEKELWPVGYRFRLSFGLFKNLFLLGFYATIDRDKEGVNIYSIGVGPFLLALEDFGKKETGLV